MKFYINDKHCKLGTAKTREQQFCCCETTRLNRNWEEKDQIKTDCA